MSEDILVEKEDPEGCCQNLIVKELAVQITSTDTLLSQSTADMASDTNHSCCLDKAHSVTVANPDEFVTACNIYNEVCSSKITPNPHSTVIQTESVGNGHSSTTMESNASSSTNCDHLQELSEKEPRVLDDIIHASKSSIQDNKNSHIYEEAHAAKSGDMEKGNVSEKDAVKLSADIPSTDNAGQPQYSTTLYGFPSLLFNLIKAMIGTGILFLPYRASVLGALPSLFLLFFSAFCSGFGLILYLWLCSKVGRNSSIKTLSDITYKSLGIIFNLIIIPKCFLVAALYIKLAVNYLYLQIIGKQTTGWKHALFTVAIAFSVLPFVLLTKMGKLRYTSYASFGAILFLVAFSIMLFAKYDAALPLPPPAKPVVNATKFILFAPMSFQTLIGFLQAIPTFMFAFTCHQNVFPIYNEAQNNSIKNMRNLVFLSVGISLCIYISFMLFSLGTFGALLQNQSNILQFYSDYLSNQQPWIQKMTAACQILFAIVLLFSVASQTLPLKTSLLNVLPIREETLKVKGREINWAISFMTVVLAIGIIMSVKMIDYFVSIVGAICSPLLMAVVPSLYYLKLAKNKVWNWKKISILAFCIFGVLLIVVCTAASVYRIVEDWKNRIP